MALEHNNIDFEQLKAYFSGKMSEIDKNALEQQALDDPFLKDAMDGFANNPQYIEEFDQVFKRKNPFKPKKSIAIRSLTIIGVLAAAYIVTTILSPEENQDSEEIVQVNDSDSLITMEVELIPQDIDTFEIQEPEELISSVEIIDNKNKIQETVDYDTTNEFGPILIDENETYNLDFEIIEEDKTLLKKERVPATFLYDMYVVDYRRIKREKTSVSYIKYELTGTSAELEGSDSQSENELIEKQVDIPYFEYLASSMEYFKDGYFKKALNRYKTILEQYEGDANALFYGGLCYYNLKKYDNAIEFFDQIEMNSLNAFKEEAKWYKAKCLLKLGSNNEAIIVLDEIISEGGFYVEDAMKAKKEL